MPFTKTPTSALSVIELLAMRVWYRAKARIRRIYSGHKSQETSMACLSPANRLPQEIVEMIINQLFYDPFSLRTCCLTCYSWYIAAVRHLHSALVTPTYRKHGDRKLWWPNSFRSMHKLGLLPLVKKFRIRGTHENPDSYGPTTFSPELFDRRISRQFSSLTNVRELGIDFLDIPSFMPKIQRYFGHFLPTLRSLALRKPKGSCRQIIFFIGLFQHLEDLRLRYDSVVFEEEPEDDPTLVPLFVPPLRGRLTMSCFTRVAILEDLINLFGGIRFRHMDLFEVHGMQLLLAAAARSLETLRLYPNDPRAEFFPGDFNLSQSKSLRALEVTMWSIMVTPMSIIRILGYALSTIRSPLFSEVIIIYHDGDIPDLRYRWDGPPVLRFITTTYRAKLASYRHKVFQVLQDLCRVRGFTLVLCADVWGCAEKFGLREIKQAVLAECTGGKLDEVCSRLSVTSSLREFLPPPGEPVPGIVSAIKWVYPWAPKGIDFDTD